MNMRLGARFSLVFAVCSLVAFALGSPVSAQDDRDALARIHFEAGASYYSQGDFERAALEFERAHALSGRVELLHNIYLSHRELGDARGAAEALRAFLEGSPDLPAERRATLEHRLAALERTVAAGAPASPEADASAEQTAAAPERAAAEASEGEGMGPLPGALVLGAGGAVLAVSLVQGLRARATRSAYDARCDLSGLPDQCRPEDAAALGSLVDDFERQRNSAWGLLIGGAVTAGVGTVLLAIGLRDDAPDATSADVACGPDGCTLRVFGSF